MAGAYFDYVSGKEIDARVPPGKFRVVGGDTFDRDSRGIFYGDFDTIDEALIKADEIAKGKQNLRVYVWNTQGQLVGQTGSF